MRKTPDWIGIVGLILVCSLFIYLRHGEYIGAPTYKVIEPYGDGFKAYTVIYYHAKYDSTYSHFEGMNYPYGEHVVPAATQPILSNTIKFISQNIVDITDYVVPIVHFSLLFSILFCGLFLYLIFRRLNLPIWYSIIVAVALSFLTPQIHRIDSHYGLAHPSVLPITIYLLMRFDEELKLKWSILIGLVVTGFSLIHFYYFAILSFAISFFFLFRYLTGRKWNQLPQYALHFGIQLILPFIFFFFWMIYNDPVTDRVSIPWGFFAYKALFWGIFSSQTQPHFQWIHTNIAPFPALNGEQTYYAGVAAMIGLLVIIISAAKNLFRKPFIRFGTSYDTFFNNFFLAAFVILLISLGLPFTISGMERLLPYTGPFKQFRGIGRFAWIFFYIINIISFTGLYYWAKQPKYFVFKAITVSVALILLAYEAYHFTTAKDLRLDEIETLKSGQRFTDLTDIDYQDYQAILPLPYYNIGSDHFWFSHPGQGYILQNSLALSVQTGLPTTSAMLTRSSLSQTINQVQLVAEPYRKPKILEEYPNDKPLILMMDVVRFNENKPFFAHWENQGKLLYEKDDLKLFHLPLSHFDDQIEKRKQTILSEISKDSLYKTGLFLATDSLENFVYQSFDDQSREIHYWGDGGMHKIMGDAIVLFEGTLPIQQAGQAYNFSTWMFINRDLLLRSEFNMFELNAQGQLIQHIPQGLHNLVKVLDTNGWALLEFSFVPKAADSRFSFFLKNDILKGEDYFFDELLIRPENKEMYQDTANYFFKNNRWFYK